MFSLENGNNGRTKMLGTEFQDMLRRFVICSILAFPILFAVMSEHLIGFPISDYITPQHNIWMQFALATPVMLWGAFPFFDSGIILGTDFQQGLFVLKPTYVRACYLEGN